MLVIDDDESVLELLRLYLQTWPIDVVETAGSGAEGWQLLQRAPYDLIILDWKLPGLSGLTIFNRLRTLPAYDRIPVLVSSGLLAKDDFRLLDEYPCTQCLAKPYTAAVFTESVTRLVESSQWYSVHRGLISKLMQSVLDKDRQAFTELQQLLAANPANMIPLTLMAARSARVRDDLKTAETLLAAGIKKQPDSVPALFELAKVLFQTKRYSEAMDLLVKAQKLSPKNLSRAHLMGEVALNQAKPEQATAFFSQALKLDPEHEGSRRGLALSGFMQEHAEETAGDEPSQVQQSFASMINLMAVALVRSGNYAEGIRRYQEAMDFVQDSYDKARLSYNLGLGYTRSGQPDEAKRWFRQADHLSGGTLAKARRALDNAAAVIAEDPLAEMEDIEPESLSAPTKATAPAATTTPATPVAPAAAATAAKKTAKPEAPKLKVPVKSEVLLIPTGHLNAAAIVALVKQSVAEQVKSEAQLVAAAKAVAQVSTLLYHPEDRGWVRAEKQLQLLEATTILGFSQIQRLLDALRVAPRPLVLIWNDGAPQGPALVLLEALLETDFGHRFGLLIHCVGDKAVQDAKLQRPYALLYDRMAIVNWTRSRFEEDVVNTFVSMQSQASILSMMHDLNKRAAVLNKGEPLPDDLDQAWREAGAKLPFPAAQVWLDVLKAKWLLRANQVAAARQLTEAVLRKVPELYAGRFAAASVEAYAGSSAPAVELAAQIQAGVGVGFERVGAIAGMLVDFGHYEAARTVLHSASQVAGFSSDYRYFYVEARLLFGEGQLEAACHCCEEAIRLYPRRWDLLQLYAEILIKCDDQKNALEVIAAAMQCVGADQLRLLLLKGRCLGAGRRWAEAEACVLRALVQAPANAEALALKAALGRRSVA